MKIGAKTQASLLAAFKTHGIADDRERQRLADLAGEAAWISVLQALAAWLAALLVVAAFASIGGNLKFGGHLFIAAVLIGTALALFWHKRDSTFRSHLALALSAAGQALLVFAWGEATKNAAFFGNAALALALSIPRTSLLHRVLCLLIAMGAGLHSFIDQYADRLGQAGVMALLGWLGVALLALAAALWLARRHWAVSPQGSYRVRWRTV